MVQIIIRFGGIESDFLDVVQTLTSKTEIRKGVVRQEGFRGSY